MADLTHFDAKGDAHMVDVSAKPVTDRVAVAEGAVTMAPETLAMIGDEKLSLRGRCWVQTLSPESSCG